MNQVYVYICSLLLEPPSLPLIHLTRPSQSTRLSSLCCIAGSHQLSIFHMVVYVCQWYFLSPSHSSPNVPTLLFSMSEFVFLPCNLVHLYHFSRFHIYMLIYLFYCFFFHSVWQTIDPSTVLQMIQFYSFYGWAIFHCLCKLCAHTHLVAQSCLTLCDPWTVAHQASLFMEFSR